MSKSIRVLRWVGVVVLPFVAGFVAMMVFPHLWDCAIWLVGGDGNGTPIWFDLGLIGAVAGCAEILVARLVAPARKNIVVAVWTALASVNAVRGFLAQMSFDGLPTEVGISLGAIVTAILLCCRISIKEE